MIKRKNNALVPYLLSYPLLIIYLTFLTLFASQANVYAQEGDSGISTDPAIIAQGKTMFEENCRACHAVDRKVVGPALKEVYNRKDLAWITAFVQNSQKVIESGDQYAVDLYNEYNKTVMTPFPFLKDEDVAAIVAYIKDQTENAAVAEVAEGGEGAEVAAADEGSIPSNYLTAILVGLLIVLILILAVLGLIISVLTKYLREKKDLDEIDREVVEQKFGLEKVLKSPGFLGIVVFIFTAIVVKTIIDGLYTVGVQQGYAPTQPIAFSHEIHAGQYEIDCNYCHTGVTKSKNANIPSANICMNCHSAIKTESEEIKKIYAALDYDVATNQYGPNQKPIEWVRVHNLPDLAYFNHSQHVNVGGIECQTCHGPIEEMAVVRQYSNLTMGWCIDCHRKTDVNTVGNEYYDKLVELHDSKDALKVKDIGGLECSKCHY
ncbi:cytochrome c3 family protein [Fulvivirgaceae bacterium BMA10]|uniref:Cytochrome c3 family protein n=1 Tax=Splendidivirga corallicola TaxID=3051826 RepID=A0ABT8KT83_9BACT|nr:cytochrome c3 family protein [Fulvivirgaceae bacterium BMA10]